MGAGCVRAVRGTTEPDDSYMERPDVRRLLERLRSERPENLAKWLPAFSTSEQAGPPSVITRVEEARSHALRRARSSAELPSSTHLRRRLDWRYNIFDAEKSVLRSSRDTLRRQQTSKTSVATSDGRLHSFLPQVIIEAIIDRRVNSFDPVKVVMESPATSSYDPVVHRFDAAVVFMDASGFTSLTEKLLLQSNGAEEIGKCINNFFTPLIEIVTDFGGDILKFSGDAITILWPIRHDVSSDGAATGNWSPDAATAVAAACRCCLEVQDKVGSFGSTPIEGLSLTLHIGVGVGPLNLLQLGGLLNRWEYCAAGPPMEEVAVAEPLAKSGETVISPSVIESLRAANLHDDFVFQAVPQSPGYESLVGYGACASRSALSPGRDLGGSSLNMTSLMPPTPPGNDGGGADRGPLVPLELSIVERYVPRTILRMVTGDLMSDEMRRATIVFLSVGNLDPGRDTKDAARMQVVARLLQRSIYALEGSLNKILVDDKGLLLLACFGLPPLNHYTDDPLRAVLAAARFIDTLREEDIIGKAGVATGTCWCGVVGSALRREYTVLGDVVNLAARLMGSASENECRVDESTRSACKHILDFGPPQTISLKGKAKPVPFYMFTGSLSSKGVQKQLDSTLMNWEGWPAKSNVHDALEKQVKRKSGPCGVIVVRGQAGCGKTEVAAHIRTWATKRGCTLLNGQSMNVTATFTVQLQCWVEVFKELMAAAAGDPYWLNRLEEVDMTPGDLVDSSVFKWNLMTTMLHDGGADDDLMSWAPMMNIILSSLDFGSKEVQAMLERDEQHSNGRSRLAELCVKLIDSFASFGSNKAGTVILLHVKSSTSFYQAADYHSSRIADAVAELCVAKRHEPNARPLILCIVSRRDIMGNDVIIENARACDGFVEVEDLTAERTGAFLGESLQNPELRKELVDYVHRASGGNPFAIRALCESMKEQGALTVTRGSWQLAPDWQDPSKLYQELRYPETMVGIALATFEKLSPPEQHILKIAAVFVHETSVDFDSSFTALDLTESQGLKPRDAVKIEEHCLRLRDLGILKDGTMSRRASVASSQASSISISDGSPDKVIYHSFFKFKSMLLRYVASCLVLRAQHRDIFLTMTQSRRTSRLLTKQGSLTQQGIEASLSTALAAGAFSSGRGGTRNSLGVP